MNLPQKKVRSCQFCHVPFVSYTPFAHLNLDFCKTCGFVWLDPHELARLIGRKIDLPPSAHPVEKPQHDSIMDCPHCDKKSLVPWTAHGTPFHRCQHCLGILIRLSDTGKIKSLFPPIISKHTENLLPTESPSSHANAEGMILRTPRFDLFAIPLAVLLALLVEKFRMLGLVAWYISMLYHELSHAMMAWLAGFPALPLPFAFTFFNPERSSLVIILFLACWTAGLLYAFNHRSLILGLIFSLLFSAQCYFSFFTSTDQSHSLVVAGGHGGEIVFGSILIASYHYQLPRKLRWDFWRFLSLLAGVFVFNQSTIRWTKIYFGWTPISWSSALGNPNHSDLSRLRDFWSWSQIHITNTYFYLSAAGAAWVVIHYGVFLGSRALNHLKGRQKKHEQIGQRPSSHPIR